MKKIVSFALCGMVCMTAGAQKANVDQAKKLIGKTEKIEEARALIQQAMENPETADKALTYYTAGKIEWDAFDKDKMALTINPNNDKINPDEMGNMLINGYNYFVKMLPLDQLPNEKGQVKPAYTKEVLKKMREKTNDFFDAGAGFFNTKKYYPEAYDAFMIFGDMPDQPFFGENGQAPVVADTVRATAYFNAGLAAWSGNKVPEASVAFRKARLNNYTGPEAYIYEIACWQNMSQNDSTMVDEAKDKIYEVAKSGFERYGMAQPIFLNNMINSMINSNQGPQALAEVDDAIAKYPDNANLYGLRGFINDRLGNEADSESDYRKAAAMPDVDFETLKNASRKIFRLGQTKWNDMEPGDTATKQMLKTDYFEAAKTMAEKAKELNPKDSDVDYILDNINYTLETYF